MIDESDAMRAPSDVRVIVRALPGGGWELRHPEPLMLPARSVGAWLAHWAEARAEAACFVSADGEVTSYADARAAVGAIAQGLLDQGLTRERPLVIVADNSVPHALLSLAAMYVGVPVCTLAPSWVCAPGEAERVRRVLNTLGPAMVVHGDAVQLPSELGLMEHVAAVVALSSVPRARETAAVEQAYARVTPDQLARVLLTSGSTDLPKLVRTTHGMLTANQAQIAQMWPWVAARPPVLCDWLPWSHTFGASHNLLLALSQGGTFHVDDGAPTPERVARSVANLRRARPTMLLNVPRGYAALLPLLEADETAAQEALGEVEVLFCAAAALRPELRARWSALAERVRGRPVRAAAGWGATETAPAATLTTDVLPHAASVGVPVPGCVLRLHPTPSGLELRARGPNVTPGYWGAAPDAPTGFDADGFWCSGDTAEWVDPGDPSAGLRITGRLVEDFKLSSGTWVAAERVREDALRRLGALVEQVVVLAPDRDELRLLLFPSAAGIAAGTDAVQAHCDAVLRAWRAAERGSSRVPVCGLVVTTPLDAAAGEVTAKGSVNQRVVRARRAALVAEVYARATP